MEKIKLKNTDVFSLVPMGIETNIFEKTRKFGFVSDLGYGDIENSFNKENIGKIEYLSNSEELLKVYTDCISLKSLTKKFNKEYEDDKFADVYIVELEIN